MKHLLETDKRFSDKGLTSTSANHLSNMALQFIEQKKAILKELSFIKQEVSVATSNGFTNRVINNGSSPDDISKINDYVKEIAEATTLVAYIREVVKARQEETDRLCYMSLNDWFKQTYPDEEFPILFNQKDSIKSFDVINKWDLDKRAKYYRLESLVSTYGDLIHKNGSYAKARKDLFDKIQMPSEVTGSGRDITIYDFSPIIDTEKVEKQFFELQSAYREAQKEFNSLKYEIETEIAADIEQKQEEYNKELVNHSQRMKELTAEKEKDITSTLSAIRKLKIVIPDNLKGIYEKINNLSK